MIRRSVLHRLRDLVTGVGLLALACVLMLNTEGVLMYISPVVGAAGAVMLVLAVSE